MTYNGENDVITFSPLLFILAGNEDMHKSLNQFEFRPDPTSDYGVTAFEPLQNRCHHFFLVAFDPILFKLAGNEDMNEIMDEWKK